MPSLGFPPHGKGQQPVGLKRRLAVDDGCVEAEPAKSSHGLGLGNVPPRGQAPGRVARPRLRFGFVARVLTGFSAPPSRTACHRPVL